MVEGETPEVSRRLDPGWYPDPFGEAQLRWWDGTKWWEQVTGAPAAPTMRQAPPVRYAPDRRSLPTESPVYTSWIWLVVLLPLASVVLVFVAVPTDAFGQMMRNVGTTASTVTPNMSVFYSPAYLISLGISWTIFALMVVFAWLDYRDLGRRGVDRPFHWAWSFLAPQVYTIGRSVIVRRVAGGRGSAPIWATIAVTVVVFAGSIAYTMLAVAAILHNLPTPMAPGA